MDPVAELRQDRESGASALARRALEILRDAVDRHPAERATDLQAHVLELAEQLRSARPSMAAVPNLVDRWIETLPRAEAAGVAEAASVLEYRRAGTASADALLLASERAAALAGTHAARHIGPGRTVMTHSMSGTVLACLRELHDDVEVIVTESRPPGEGRSLARVLSDLGVRTRFISDGQIGVFAARADVALVGADTVAADGAVVNKAGTRLLALAAADVGIPFYACFESLKQSSATAADIHLEEHDPGELELPALPCVTVHNVYFDVTPAALVSAWITEEGVRSR